MDKMRIAYATAPDYALRRVRPDGSERPAGAYPDFALYRGERRIARFGFNRLVPRAAAGNLDALVAI